MPGPWITNGRLRTLFADAIKVPHESLVGRHIDLVERSNDSAANDITAALIARNYTIAQIDAWDRRIEFNEDLGLFWCFVRGNVTGTYSDLMINKLDRRKELLTIQLTVDSVIVIPGGATSDPDGDINGGGVVSGGQFLQDSWRFDMNKEF